MRKRIVGSNPGTQAGEPKGDNWIALAELATVEVSSEEPAHPIERAFVPGDDIGWRAGGSGEQRIKLLFDQPVAIRRIHLRFHEPQQERTQEFRLSYCLQSGETREVVRQQWNFSPGGSKTEIENYEVDLTGVVEFELTIRPDLQRPDAVASLAAFRLA